MSAALGILAVIVALPFVLMLVVALIVGLAANSHARRCD